MSDESLQAYLAALEAAKHFRAERDTLIDAAICPFAVVHYWRIGPHSGHEPTRELAREAVKRVVGLGDVS